MLSSFTRKGFVYDFYKTFCGLDGQYIALKVFPLPKTTRDKCYFILKITITELFYIIVIVSLCRYRPI